mgnify:CR=1 FL=1
MTRLSDRHLNAMILASVTAGALGWLLLNGDFGAFGAMCLMIFAVVMTIVGMQLYQYRGKALGMILTGLGGLTALMLPFLFWAVST